MPFTVLRPGRPPEPVDADDHAVEGAHHVFRRDVVVLGRPRRMVVLRVPVAGAQVAEQRPASAAAAVTPPP